MVAPPVPLDAALSRYLGAQAVDVLNDYFRSGRFTGGSFDRFRGGGDRPETANRFTSDDIVAVSLLGVRIPGWAALGILEDQKAADEFTALLARISGELDLWQAPEDDVGPNSSAERLWRRLVDLPGIGWVTAGKLLARKRPRLIPVYDRVVKQALGRRDGDEWWRPLRTALVVKPDVVSRLQELRRETGLDVVSLLRILDVCIWMQGGGTPEPAPDAET